MNFLILYTDLFDIFLVNNLIISLEKIFYVKIFILIIINSHKVESFIKKVWRLIS